MTEEEMRDWIETVVKDTVKCLDIEVSRRQERQLMDYLRLLAKWNDKINLVSRRNVQTVVADRLYDALLLWREFRPWTGKRHLDIGSGGGFPAVPIHVMAPDATLWLTEPRARRVSFLATVTAELDLENVEVKRCRVGANDSVLPQDARFDVITAQAVGPPKKMFELASGRLADHGRYVWINADGLESVPCEFVNVHDEKFLSTVCRHARPAGEACWSGCLTRTG